MADKPLLIQIYEIQFPRAVEPLVAMGVDHIGSVVLDEQRWKMPELRDTVRLVKESGAKSCLIPLLTSVDAVSRVLDYYQPDIVHFCDAIPVGTERRKPLDLIFKLQMTIRERFPEIRKMRTLPVGPPGSGGKERLSDIAALFEPATDFFLADTVLPPAGGADSPENHQPVPGFVGITGTPCDWDAVSALVESTRVPVILAGGISPDNVFEAIVRTRPSGVDSCTRTNREDGRGGSVRFEKDFEKVRRLVSEVRRAECMDGKVNETVKMFKRMEDRTKCMKPEILEKG